MLTIILAWIDASYKRDMCAVYWATAIVDIMITATWSYWFLVL